jgi:hypothetical protein
MYEEHPAEIQLDRLLSNLTPLLVVAVATKLVATTTAYCELSLPIFLLTKSTPSVLQNLSTKAEQTGIKGNNASGKTTFFTKLGWPITNLAACINPLVNAVQGIKSANNHKPKVKLLSGNSFKLSLTFKTIDKT